MSGPHFPDCHIMPGEHANQLCAMTDPIADRRAPIAERIRKPCGTTLRSIGHIARTQRILANDADDVEPSDMLGERCEDNKSVAARLGKVHNVCDEHRHIVTSPLRA